MGAIRHFTDLIAYQKAFALGREVFLVTKRFPPDERFSLTDQIRRSVRSIGSNMAEAWGKRRYRAHFVSKLTDADTERFETEHWLLARWITATSTSRLLNVYSNNSPKWDASSAASCKTLILSFSLPLTIPRNGDTAAVVLSSDALPF
jgi:four helix bundle protein